jgi:hypothetical protein
MNEPQAGPPSTPPTFVIGASSFFRHLTFVIRHSQTETVSKPRNITFYLLRFENHIPQLPNVSPPAAGGRARHSVRAAIGIQAGKLSRLPLSHGFSEHS